MPQLHRRRHLHLVEYLRRTGWRVWKNGEIGNYRYRLAVVDLWDIGASV